jgi:hypothetical protein
MIRCPQIVLPIGSAPAELVPVIPNSPIVAGLKPDLRIWQFFFKAAHLTACFAKTGITGRGCGRTDIMYLLFRRRSLPADAFFPYGVKAGPGKSNRADSADLLGDEWFH